MNEANKNHLPISDTINSVLTAMPAVLDLASDVLDTCIMRNFYTVLVFIVYLELEAPKVHPVTALAEDLTGPVVPFHGVAGVFQLADGKIVIAPILAGIEAFRGCRGGIDGGNDGKDFGDLHVEGS